MAKEIVSRNGKKFTLYNPSEKASHYCEQIKSGKLSKTQFTYRSGYLAARKDAAKIWKSQQRKNKKKSK